MAFFKWTGIVTGFVVLISGLVVLGSLLNGLVIQRLWSWFVVPAFNLHPLTFPISMGLGLFVAYLTYHQTDYKKDDRKFDWGKLLGYYLYPFFVLLTGYVIKQFV